LGLDERRVRATERDADALGKALNRAAQAIGVPPGQRRELTSALREGAM
jgi:hypothetical protein